MLLVLNALSAWQVEHEAFVLGLTFSFVLTVPFKGMFRCIIFDIDFKSYFQLDNSSLVDTADIINR